MGLEIVELVMRIEEEFDVDIPDGYAEKLTTIGHIEAYLAARLGTPEAEREALFQKLRAIVVDELSIPPNKVHRTARLVEDLDLD